MYRFLSPVSGQSYTIRSCREADFEAVKQYVHELELDDRKMDFRQFLTMHNEQDQLVGFGRVREYKGFSEMCSLGILRGERSKGLAKEMTAQMIKKATQVTYLVCIMPLFFEEFGFRICDEYPAEIKEKLDYCLDSLAVPEPYVVMIRNK
jgi:N-acetylglutamate synthase-like GNAT family acetyltransferase